MPKIAFLGLESSDLSNSGTVVFYFYFVASKKRPMFGPAGGKFDRRKLDEMNMTIDVHVDRSRSDTSGMETD